MSTNVTTGSALFSDAENFMGFVQDLSEQDELMFAGGGGYGYGKSKGKGKDDDDDDDDDKDDDKYYKYYDYSDD